MFKKTPTTPLSPAEERFHALRNELAYAYGHHREIGNIHTCFAYVTMFLTVGTTILAGVGGIFYDFDGSTCGGLALLSGFIGILANKLKIQERANWRYRWVNEIGKLQTKLIYGLPPEKDLTSIAEIAEEFDRLNQDMHLIAVEQLSLKWNEYPHTLPCSPDLRKISARLPD